MNVYLNVDTASFARLTATLHRKKDMAIQAGIEATRDTADLVLAESNIRMPKVTGALAASGKVTNQKDDSAFTSVVSYGDSSVNPVTGRATSTYAVRRHESDRNGKWLENSLLDCAGLYREELVTKISRSLAE